MAFFRGQRVKVNALGKLIDDLLKIEFALTIHIDGLDGEVTGYHSSKNAILNTDYDFVDGALVHLDEALELL